MESLSTEPLGLTLLQSPELLNEVPVSCSGQVSFLFVPIVYIEYKFFIFQ